jgi:predicted nucleic acid-binding protein
MKLGKSEPKRLWGTEVMLDSNVFLEVELAEEHAESCKRLLNRVKDGDLKAAITDFHVDSIIVVMENYDKGWKDLALFLASLLRYKGLKIHFTNLSSRIKATSFMRDYHLNFDSSQDKVVLYIDKAEQSSARADLDASVRFLSYNLFAYQLFSPFLYYVLV